MQIQSGRAILARGGSDRPAIPPVAGLALGMVAFSTSSIMTRDAQAHAPSLVIAAFRMGLATLVLIPLACLRYTGDPGRLDRSQLLLWPARRVFLAIHFGTWITSLEYTTVASSLARVWTSPIFVAPASPWALGESITRPVMIGLIASMTGGVIFGLSDTCTWQARLVSPPAFQFVHGKAIFGDMLALVEAIAGAGFILLGRRLRHVMPLIPYISLAYGAAATLLAIPAGTLRLPVLG